jgi:hypothetical protein
MLTIVKKKPQSDTPLIGTYIGPTASQGVGGSSPLKDLIEKSLQQTDLPSQSGTEASAIAKVVDRLYALEIQIEQVKPLVDAYAQAKRELSALVKEVECDPSNEISIKGSMAVALISACTNTREVLPVEAVAEIVGIKTLLSIVTINMALADKYLSGAQKDLIFSPSFGSRRIVGVASL